MTRTILQQAWNLQGAKGVPSLTNGKNEKALYMFTGPSGQRLKLTVEDALHIANHHFEHTEPGSVFRKNLSLGEVLKMVTRHLPMSITYTDNQAFIHLHMIEIVGLEGIATLSEMIAGGLITPIEANQITSVQNEIFQRNLYDTVSERARFAEAYNADCQIKNFHLTIRDENIVNAFNADQVPTNELTVVIGREGNAASSLGRIRTVYPGRPMTRLPADPPISYLEVENPGEDLRKIYECWKEAGFLTGASAKAA